jgi:hypothetical protein
MKKLRMILTSVIVLAIVVSAFAFNAKKFGPFCVDTSIPPDGICDVILHGKKIDPVNGTTIHYYNGWNGAAETCTGKNCGSTVKVVNNP